MKKAESFELRSVPFVRFLTIYLLGVGIGYLAIPTSFIYSSLWILELSSLCLFFGIAIGSNYANFRFYKSLSILFYFFLFFLGWQLMWKNHPEIEGLHFSQQSSEALIGYVDDEPKSTKTGLRFPLKIIYAIQDGKKDKRTGSLSVNMKLDSDSLKRISDFQYGDRILIPARFSKVKSPMNPHEFNYQAYLADHAIWHQAYLTSADVLKLDASDGNALIKYALNLRRQMVKKLTSSVNDNDVSAIASALLLGDRNNIDKEILNTFSVTGTIHVLSVSGLHVGIVFAVFSTLLFWMRDKKWKVAKALILIFFVWVYAFITGLAPSVLRASIMISFGIVALNLSRRANIYNTIAASAFFLLLYNPYYIFDIGFKLSYLAVIGIVFLYPKIYGILKIKNRLLALVWSSAAISIAAQIATFPLVLYYFHFFPMYFLPANILVILPVSLIVYLGLLVLLVPFGVVHSWLSMALETTILKMNRILNIFEDLPYATLGGIWIEPWQYLLLYGALVGCVYFISYKKRQGVYILIGCLFMLFTNRAIEKYKDLSLEEIRIYNVYKNIGIGFFNKDGVVIFTDSLNQNSQRFQYSIAPDVDASVDPSTLVFVNQGDSLRTRNLLVKHDIIQFGNKSILFYSAEQQYNESLSVDLVYVRKNALLELQKLKENIRFEKLLLDGSNSDWYIRKIQEEAENLDISIYVLKNNFAYVW